MLRNPSTEGLCRLLNAGHVPFDHPRVEFIKILNALDTPMWCRKAPNAWRLTCGRVPEPGGDFVRARVAPGLSVMVDEVDYTLSFVVDMCVGPVVTAWPSSGV